MDRQDAIKTLREQIQDIKVAMLTTIEADGVLHARPMATQVGVGLLAQVVNDKQRAQNLWNPTRCGFRRDWTSPIWSCSRSTSSRPSTEMPPRAP